MRYITLRSGLAIALATMAVLALPAPAAAWWHHGPRWFGGFYVAPPVYVAPAPYPPYYAPSPVAAGGCYAGPYVCPLREPAYAGQSCACDTAQGRFWGYTR
jgi:hypothetical protein